MKRAWVGLLVAVVVSAAVAGCGSDDRAAPAGASSAASSGSTGLTGTSWSLATYQVPGAGPTVRAAAEATLSFGDGGALSGSTGCNSFGGSYRAGPTSLQLTLGPMTQKACADPAVTAQETALVRLLPTVTTYSQDARSLTLRDGSGTTVLVYNAGATGLSGTAWKVTGVNNGKGAVVTSTLTETLTAAFAGDGTFAGFGGCNQLSGPFTTSGSSGVTIGPLASTHRSCGADVDQLEAEYATALGLVTTYDVTGSTLTLRDSSGATQVTATAG